MLTPQLIRRLERAAEQHGDAPFFAVRHGESIFVTNWVFGMQFDEVVNCPALFRLLEQTDKICEDETKESIVHHITQRGWFDMFAGNGLQQDVELTQLKPKERRALSGREWSVLPFRTIRGMRYFVREGYFDIAEDVLGKVVPVIFRPINSTGLPNYRPMIFYDEDIEPRGMCHAISEDNLFEPVDRAPEYQQLVEESPFWQELRGVL